MITEQQLAGVAQRLTGVPGVVGVTLGGSRARRTHEPTSDVDLGLYYRPPLDVGVLRQLAQEFAGPLADVSSPGDWGPWVDGGGWLNIADTPVDWIYRNIDRVRASCTDALAGRFELHFQVGHPFGVPNVAYAAELAVGIILSDPSAQLSDLRETIGNYPPLLRNAMVERLWEATFLLGGARKSLLRQDTAYVAGCLFRVLLLCASALHGHAGRWLTNEKGAVRSAGRLPNAPTNFEARANSIVGFLGTTDVELEAAITTAEQLLADVTRVCSVSGR